MEIGINDLHDDDDFTVNPPVTSEPPVLESEDDTFMLDFLKSKGIDDPEKINFEDESGQIQTKSWNDLTREEQFNILNTPQYSEDPSNESDQINMLTDEEILFLNTLRQNGITPQLYIQALQLSLETVPTYSVDNLSDDELYLLDLESRVGELNEDQAAQALGTAKQDEELYKKQVEGIRKEYKEREDYKAQQEQLQNEEAYKAAYLDYQAKVVDAIDSFDSIGNLDLNFEDADKEELASFMLSQDESGKNYFYQALQDPETQVKAAWFILNGDEAFNNISDYFTNLIKLISENQYKRGFEDGKKGVSSRPAVVINKNTNNRQHKSYTTIDQLQDDDD